MQSDYFSLYLFCKQMKLMKAEIHYSQVPSDYPLCLNSGCPHADTCLRQLVVQSIPENIPHWVIVSPSYLATLEGEDCPFYRSAAKARFAKGCVRLLENLPYKQMQAVISQLISCFSQRTYYRIRKGERLLSPAEQQQVLDILKKCGVDHPQEFDAYVEQYDW